MYAHGLYTHNGFCIEVFAWCFDRKWWLHTYTCNDHIRFIYIYIYIEQVQISSPFSGDLSLYLTHAMHLVGFPHRNPSGKVPSHSRAGVSSLKGLPFSKPMSLS
jgi:hypothetical protein